MTETPRRRVLFVDDEHCILRGLQRQLRERRLVWDMEFCDSAEKGIELMKQQAFDVVVSDMRMPGMDGADFLAYIRDHYANTARLVLSGHSSRELSLRAIGGAHQYISKPCDASDIKLAIERSLNIRDALRDPTILEFVLGLEVLPSIPGVFEEFRKALDQGDVSMEIIGDIVASDIGLTAKMLQLVNSDFLGLRMNVSDAREAVVLLGPEVLRSLVSSINVFEKANLLGKDCPHLKTIWKHSLSVGALAKQICFAETSNLAMACESFTAGMLHDVGKILLLINKENYQTLYQEKDSSFVEFDLVEWEKQNYGVTHSEVGAYLLALWGLPDHIVEAVLFHHEPWACSEIHFSPLTAIHAADYIYYEMFTNTTGQSGSYSEKYLGNLGCSDKMQHWTVLSEISQLEGIVDKIVASNKSR